MVLAMLTSSEEHKRVFGKSISVMPFKNRQERIDNVLSFCKTWIGISKTWILKICSDGIMPRVLQY